MTAAFDILLAPPPLDPARCRAARGLLGWSRDELAVRTRVGIGSIARFEGGRSAPHHRTLAVMRQAFEEAGVRFSERGVELAP